MPSSAAEYIFSLVRTAKLDQGSRGGFGFEVLGDRRDGLLDLDGVDFVTFQRHKGKLIVCSSAPLFLH